MARARIQANLMRVSNDACGVLKNKRDHNTKQVRNKLQALKAVMGHHLLKLHPIAWQSQDFYVFSACLALFHHCENSRGNLVQVEPFITENIMRTILRQVNLDTFSIPCHQKARFSVPMLYLVQLFHCPLGSLRVLWSLSRDLRRDIELHKWILLRCLYGTSQH